MSSGSTLQTLDANTKKVYGEFFMLEPEGQEVLMNKIGAAQRVTIGKEFVVEASLGLDHSTTFLGSDDSSTEIEDPIAGAVGNATVKSSRLVFPVAVSTAVADRMTGGQLSFENGPQLSIDRAVKSFRKVLETMHNHGGNGIGTFTYASADANVITIDAAEWAPAVWIGAVKRPLDIYAISGGVVGAKIGTYSVSKINTLTRKITLNTNASLVNGNTYVIFPRGAKGKEARGLFNILKQSSGDLFGLSVDDHDLWGANIKNVSSNTFDWDYFASAVSEYSGRGVAGDNYMILINDIHFPKMVPNMNTAKTGAKQAATYFPANHAIQFMSPQAAGSIDLGTDKISFRVNGVRAELVCSNYVKRGEAAMLDLDTWVRVTSAQNGEMGFARFGDPGAPGEYWRLMEKREEYLARIRADQALFCPEMNKQVYFYGLETGSLA